MMRLDGLSPRRKKAAAHITGAASVFWLSFIFSNSLKSKAESADQSELAEGFLRRVLAFFGFSGDGERVAEIVVRKAAHVFEFFVLALLIYLVLRLLEKKSRVRLVIPTVFGILAAAVDESLQIISKRGASVRDVFIDAFGVLLAVGLVYLVWERKRPINSAENKQ